MQVDEQDLQEFMTMYQRKTGRALHGQEAHAKAIALLNFLKAVVQRSQREL